jgi:Domain of unknown function (DUF6379)/Xylose isomerase-like TIM barrel
MYDKYLIQTQGFQNAHDGGRAVGFEVGIRIGYYRGVALALISGLTLIVDGEVFEGELLRFKIRGRAYSMDQLSREETARWEFGETATLVAARPGGLTAGAHDVEFVQSIKPAYIPGNGFVSRTKKRLTLAPARAASAARVQRGVSLYSYQEEYYTRSMSLDDCLAEVAAIGATGVQLISEQMIPGYPNPPAVWVERWHESLREHRLKPTLMDTFVDVDCGGHRNLSLEEGVQRLVEQMKLAKSLGFDRIRPTTGPVADSAPELLRAALPHAEELDVRIAPEIHAPIELKGPYVESYLELIARTGTRHLGFTLDFGIFCQRLPPAFLARALRDGAQPRVVEFVERAFVDRTPQSQVLAQVERIAANHADQMLGWMYGAFGPASNDPKDLAPLIPHIFNVHGKFYEITPEGVEESIPYDAVVGALVAGGYAGHIDSEYEGQRLTQDIYPTDSCEQVRRHHLLLARTLR